MSRKTIQEEWTNIVFTDEQLDNLARIERNPVYRDVVNSHGREYYPESDPVTFHDVLYWLDFEANEDQGQNMDSKEHWMYSAQATASINRWFRKYYPDYAKSYNRPWGNY